MYKYYSSTMTVIWLIFVSIDEILIIPKPLQVTDTVKIKSAFKGSLFFCLSPKGPIHIFKYEIQSKRLRGFLFVCLFVCFEMATLRSVRENNCGLKIIV